MPSEQPREGTQERYIDQWPKPMFLCTYCDEQTDSDPCQECASVFDERGENYPPVLRFQVVPAPAQPEQSGRVAPEQLRLVRNMAKIEASQSDPEQAPAFTDERRASHRRRADALNAVLAALEPASPTPTEQENDR